MATVTEMRSWLRDQGHEVPPRGRLRDELVAIYDDAHPDEAWDLGGDEDDLTIPEPEAPEEGFAPEVMRPERPPSRPRRPPRPKLAQRVFGSRQSQVKDNRARGKKKHAPVPLDNLIGRVWGTLARVAMPLSLPVATTLTLQSPVAGKILAPVLHGTVIDKALQPIARSMEKGEAVVALVGPPVLVAAIERSFAYDAAGQVQKGMVQRAFLEPLLDEALRVWLKVAGPSMEEVAREQLEWEEKYGATIRSMKEMIFRQPVPEPAPEPEPAAA